MPPRLSSKLLHAFAQDGTQAVKASSPAGSSIRPFSSSLPTQHKSRNWKPRVYKDPWTIKREAAKRAAVLARRQASAEGHRVAAGDPVRGAPAATAFVASLDAAMDPGRHMLLPAERLSSSPAEGGPGAGGQTAGQAGASSADGPKPDLLNHFLSQKALAEAVQESRAFSAPYVAADRDTADPAREQREAEAHAAAHGAREEALRRIVAPENASARERLLINKRRIVDRFGRHNTDGEFGVAGGRDRVGPDTGSSEVQIAILTAKIRAMADRLEGHEGRFDWVNKRNLRLLLHKRQKLLKYFERRERGGPRWQNLLETLGLTEATWKGEIELR